jgi:hypothetical protein
MITALNFIAASVHSHNDAIFAEHQKQAVAAPYAERPQMIGDSARSFGELGEGQFSSTIPFVIMGENSGRIIVEPG